MSIITDGLVLSGFGCAAYFVWCKFKTNNHPHAEANNTQPPIHGSGNRYNDGYSFKDETTFEEVSKGWTTPEKEVVEFADVAKRWRKPQKTALVDFPLPIFNHKEINRFWAKRIEGRNEFTVEKRKIISAILGLLDREGDCASVVNSNKAEAERGFSKRDYQILEKISLWDHSLRVADLFLKAVPHNIMGPDAVITALAHDIGKIPSIYGKHYATGDHPIIARYVLDAIPEMAMYHRLSEIRTVIEEHHLPGTKDSNAQLLLAADREARKIEIGLFVTDDVKNKTTLNAILPSDYSVNSEFTTFFTNPQKPAGAMRMQQNRTPSPPPSWFNEDIFRKELRSRINVVQDGNWQAVSMPNGIVWVKFATLNEVIVASSGELPEVRGLGADRAAQSALTLSVLTACKECLVTGMLREGESATKCTVTSAKGRSNPVFLTPIKTQWFLTTPSALETEKDADIKRMVIDISLNRDPAT